MYRFLVVATVFLAAVFPLTAEALWQSAVATFIRNRDVYASRMLSESAEYDGRGSRRSHREMEVSLSVEPDGSLTQSLLWARENGVTVEPSGSGSSADPVFSKDARDAGSEGRAASMAIMEHSPFDPRFQSQLDLTRIEPPSPASEPNGIEYQYLLTTESAVIDGRTWLDEKTGAPLRLVATIRPLPRFLREMTVEQTFDSSATCWFTKKVSVRADGGFLFIRRTVEVDLYFFDHTRSPIPLRQETAS